MSVPCVDPQKTKHHYGKAYSLSSTNHKKRWEDGGDLHVELLFSKQCLESLETLLNRRFREGGYPSLPLYLFGSQVSKRRLLNSSGRLGEVTYPKIKREVHEVKL